MKKTVRVISLLVLTLCLGLALTACAKEDGKYVVNVGDGDHSYTQTLELKDGKFTVTVDAGDESQEVAKGTYKIKGDKFTATDEAGNKYEGTIKKGKSITIKQGDNEVTYTYKK